MFAAGVNTALPSSIATVAQCCSPSHSCSAQPLSSRSLATASVASTPVNTLAGVTVMVLTDSAKRSWLKMSPLNR